MTDEPANIKAVHSTNFSHFEKGKVFQQIWYDVLFNSALSSDGETWHANKKLLCLHLSRLRETDLAVAEKHTQILFQGLSSGTPVECLDHVGRWAFDVASDVFFGGPVGALTGKKSLVTEALESIFAWNTRRTLLGKLGTWLPDNPKESAVWVEYLDHTIDEAAHALEQSKSLGGDRLSESLLGTLLREKLSRERIRDQMAAAILGGKDPIPIALTWAFYELSRNPHLAHRLRTEILLTIGPTTPPTRSQLKDMPFLQSVIKETLRLHPPLGFNIRTAYRATTLPVGGGPTGQSPVAVAPGAHVLLSYVGVQCRQDLVGPTADVFDPSRWERWSPPLWGFLPFSHGPRVCLGRNYAWTQMEYLLCRVFQTFDTVELMHVGGARGKENMQVMKTKFSLTNRPAEPVMLRFVLN